MPNRRGRGITDYAWTGVADAEVGMDLAEGTVRVGTAFAVFNAPQTVMRVRGWWGATLDAGAVDESVMLVAGLIVLSDPVIAGAAGSIPSPVTESALEWLWQGSLYLSSGAEAAIVPDALTAQGEIDTRAMRRVKQEQNLAFVAEIAASVDQAGTVDFSYYYRTLIGS